MADRTCRSCGKVFDKPCHLKKHADRKTPCAPIIDVAALPSETLSDPDIAKKRCRFCGRVYSTPTNRAQHEKKNCKINRDGKGLDMLYEHTRRQQGLVDLQELHEVCDKKDRQLEESQRQLDRMQTMMSNLMDRMERKEADSARSGAAGGAVINQVQNNVSLEQTNIVTNDVSLVEQTNCVTNTFTVNIFGQESVDHITAPQIYRLLMEATRSADPAMQALLEAALVVFSDPAKPENITCYLPNKKTSEALVHEAGGWQIRPVETVLDPMVKRSVYMLFKKQPYGHEKGLPDTPDITACGDVLKQIAELEKDPKASAPHGPLRSVLVKNKDTLSRANGGKAPEPGSA